PGRAGEPHPVVAQPRSPRSVLPSAKAQSQSKIPPTPPRRTNKRLSYGVQMNMSASNSAEEMLAASQRRKVMASRDDFELELSELSAMKRSATAMPRSPRAAMMMSLGGTFDLFPETSEPKFSVQAELLRGSSWHEVSLLPGETIVWRCSYVCLLYQDEAKKVFRSKKNKRQMFSTSRASNNDASELQIRSSDPTAQGESSYAELLASKSPVFIEKKGEQRYTASIDGRLLLSDHKVIFTPKLDSPLGCIEVPLMYIKKVKKAVLPCTLVLFLHDGRVIVLSFAAHPPETTKIFLARLRSVIPAKFSSETIFAFKYHRGLSQLREHSTRLSSIDAKHYYHQAWKFDIILDYARLGLPNRKWHVVNNRDFAICATYPTYLCVPSSIDVATIMKAAQFRTKGRIPVLTWKHPTSDATLCRSSQPNVGLLGSGDRSDEMLMEAIKASNPNSATLHLCDARPKVNAEANKLLGAGYESTSAYKGMKIKFFSIDNIHVMRDSWQKLQTLCQPQNEGNDRWLSDLEATGWFQHLKKIMAGVLHIVHLIEDEGASVVIHCSDGWDRTAQLCSLAQMLLDPFYRTVHGFAVLIEKDWLAFGHKFQERTGHLYRQHPSERSPVFLQFLDCCYQLIQQFPFSFEFNTALLRFIGEAAADQIFGTFLCNSAKERGSHGIYQETESAWSYVFSNIESFTSSLYAPSVTRDVLYPSIAIQSFKLWETYHFRWSHTTKVKRTATAVDELASENSKLLAILREKEKELEQLIRNESGQKK
ncbi:MAG: myotubularin family protein, partial [archaeon]|nr:myotubularin family protein [archaeon]